ncbi:uncharacterized protein PpBr36_10986 [Pyricularia pennisetigena]|uniref:uncharacterized protein n=1 Tax=Pyricularia pennisetigena TaxID=1578925 RepID=UPI00114D52BA|nr:uncharacterized protein PpBr36_10986 [Pyricularia pennisetigena]TLS20793.1 hypothetical protein PpBr36_10986 [Pyricularia pennisetigena]
MDWIEAVHRRSRGLDLGSLGPSILPDVFREQSAKWETIAKQYLSKIILLVHRFILTALEVVCADSQVLQNVSSAILSDLCTTYESTHATETIHDTLEAYYKVAYKRFVDNVSSQAVDYQLLSGPKSPLQLFSEQWVLCLKPDKLILLAGESRRTRERRERLEKEVQDLEIAIEILR